MDDEQAVRDIAVRILGGFGYRAFAASTGHEAVKHFNWERGSIDAVITDMAMPGMDGPALVKVLRQIEPDIRIMGMSGHGENAGGDTTSPWTLPVFLAKPFTVDKLLVAVHELLQIPRQPA